MPRVTPVAALTYALVNQKLAATPLVWDVMGACGSAARTAPELAVPSDGPGPSLDHMGTGALRVSSSKAVAALSESTAAAPSSARKQAAREMVASVDRILHAGGFELEHTALLVTAPDAMVTHHTSGAVLTAGAIAEADAVAEDDVLPTSDGGSHILTTAAPLPSNAPGSGTPDTFETNATITRASQTNTHAESAATRTVTLLKEGAQATNGTV